MRWGRIFVFVFIVSCICICISICIFIFVFVAAGYNPSLGCDINQLLQFFEKWGEVVFLYLFLSYLAFAFIFIYVFVAAGNNPSLGCHINQLLQFFKKWGRKIVLLIPLCPLITRPPITIYLPVTSHKHERAQLNTTNLPPQPKLDKKDFGRVPWYWVVYHLYIPLNFKFKLDYKNWYEVCKWLIRLIRKLRSFKNNQISLMGPLWKSLMSYCWCNGVSEIAMDEMGWEGRGVITLFMVTENKLWAKE